MATRAQVASSAERKQSRMAALAVIEGEPLPLPTDPRDEPVTYSPELSAECVQLGAQGLSESQIAAHWAIDVETLRGWADTHPLLKAALSRARTAMRSWWEEKARRAIVTGDNRFPAGAWSQVMRARFSEYDDKATVNVRIDLGRLVMIDLRSPELPDQQMVADPNPLIEHATGQLASGQTASHTPDAASLRQAGSSSAAEEDGPGARGGRGVGGKPGRPGARGGSGR